MKFEEYAAQHAQQMQEAQETPTAQSAPALDDVAARIDAESLQALREQMRVEIAEGTAPGEMLQVMAEMLFGDHSPEAAEVSRIIAKAQRPAGEEMALSQIKERRKLLTKLQKQLNEKAGAIGEELEELAAEESSLTRASMEGAALDAALMAGLSVCREDDTPQNVLKQAERLTAQYSTRPAVLGLTLERLQQLTRSGLASKALDLEEQQRFKRLKDQICAQWARFAGAQVENAPEATESPVTVIYD